MKNTASDIEQLVATYAPLGREQQRARVQGATKKRLGVAGAIAMVGVIGLGLSQLDLTGLQLSNVRLMESEASLRAADENLRAAERLGATLAEQLARIDSQRAQLLQQQTLLQQQRKVMQAEAAALDEQKASLLGQRQTLAAQAARLEAAHAELSAKQRDLGTTRESIDQERPRLAAAITEMQAQRQTLDEERKRFRAQRQLLEHEIGLLNEQRTALQNQQQELQAQWDSLQGLMEQAVNQPGPASSRDTEALMAVATPEIDDGDLGEIRGGFDLGGKLDINIGLTRTVGINGVEQYSSALNFDGMNLISAADLASMPAVIIQNGSGNTADTTALGASAGSLPVIIQNTLDNQHIINANVFDVTISNVASRAIGISADSAISDSLAFQN